MNHLASFGSSERSRRPLAGRTDSAADLFSMIHELAGTGRRLQDGGAPGKPSADLESQEDLAGKVRRLLRDRERRKRIFPPELFADPAWDILLNLYASYLEQRRETITGIICVAGVPATTGLRWVHKLVEDDLLILRDDPLDLRRKWVLLSPTALAAMRAYFSAEAG